MPQQGGCFYRRHGKNEARSVAYDLGHIRREMMNAYPKDLTTTVR
jgi:hypothetical protein